MEPGLEPGLSALVERVVEQSDTASEVGSGDLPVLATPRLLALAEQATCAAVAGSLAAGSTTVGTRVSLEHVRATPVGGSVVVRATLVHVDGRLLRFDVAAEDGGGTLVGHGEVTRVVVDAERFLSRLPSRPA